MKTFALLLSLLLLSPAAVSAQSRWELIGPVNGYAKSGLPTPTTGKLARVTDDVRGLWMGNGTQFFPLNGGITNVKEFGARGDGATADEASIQAAINAATPGSVVYVPPGTYIVNDTLLTKSNLRIYGAGVGISILQMKSGMNEAIFANSVGTQLANIEIAHLTLDGNGSNQTAGQALLGSNGVTGLWLHNLKVTNSREYCIGLEHGSHINVFIDNVIIENCRRDGIDIKNENNDNTGIVISNVTIKSPGMTLGSQAGEVGSSGIDARGPAHIANVVVTGLDADQDGIRFHRDQDGPAPNCNVVFCNGGEKSTLIGFEVRGVSATSTGAGVRIRDNYVVVSDGNVTGMNRGVWLESSAPGTVRNVQVARVIINGAKAAGVDAGSLSSFCTYDSLVVNNTSAGPGFSMSGDRFKIVNSHIEGSSTNGISIGTDIDNGLIQGNTIRASGAVGVSIASGDDDTLLIGNSFQANATDVVNSGTNTLAYANSGFVTRTRGTATITSAATSVVVNHGLAVTPNAADIAVTPINHPTNDLLHFWVDTVTATQFTINVEASPGVATAIFSWRAEALR